MFYHFRNGQILLTSKYEENYSIFDKKFQPKWYLLVGYVDGVITNRSPFFIEKN